MRNGERKRGRESEGRRGGRDRKEEEGKEGRKKAEMRESRTQRLKDGVWGRGTLSSSGAKSFLRGSVGSLNLPPPTPVSLLGWNCYLSFPKKGMETQRHFLEPTR